MYPRVGVAVIVRNDNDYILLGLRIGSHGSGTWAPPGGHLEFGETIITCAHRELAEETDLLLYDPVLCGLTEDMFENPAKHYVTIFVQGKYAGNLINKEPHRCETWDWFSMHALPKPLFLPFQQFISQSPIEFSQKFL